MFETFVIDAHTVHLSIIRSVKRWISKSYCYYWKGFKYTKNGIYIFTVQDKHGTHQQLKKTQTKKQLRIIQDHPGKNTRMKSMLNFEQYVQNFQQYEYFCINVTIIFSCGININVFYVKYLIQVSTKLKMTCIFYDIINILHFSVIFCWD